MRTVLHLANVVALVALTSGCATILRSSTRDVTVYGPDDLRVEGVAMSRVGSEGGKAKYEAEIHRKAETIKVHAGGVDATVPLEKHTGAGWVVADFLLGGEILKVGTRFKMSLKLHDTHEGRLLSTTVASGRTIDELDESAQAAAKDLLTPQ